MEGTERSETASLKRFQASACVVAAFLQKFAKHWRLSPALQSWVEPPGDSR